jgi:hypothetical protein
MYKLVSSFIIGQPSECVMKIDTRTFIPFAPDNTDYQKYLKWVAEGNTPLPADE